MGGSCYIKAVETERLWNSEYIKVWCSNFLLYFAFMLMTPLLPLYLADTFDANKEVIGLVLSGYAIAALVMRPFSGYIVDSWPRKTVLLVTYFLTCAFFGGYLLTGTRSLREGKIVRNATWGIVVSISGFVLFCAIGQQWAYYLAPLVIGLGNGHLWPAFQTMFINLAEHNQRGTANSTLLTGWDLGMAVGMFIGGSVAEHYGYHMAFWTGVMLYAAGVIFYFVFARAHFIRHKLR